MASQLHTISAQLGISAATSRGGDVTIDSSAVQGKAKLRVDSNDVFPFAPKLVQVELPLFTGKYPNEWLALDIKHEVLSHHPSSMIEVQALARF
ncbi:hypothetical protein GOBAR_AA22870 [Gossypium barbadense]|uniref:Uncharacterized protein n=1 Tax=Gossypium barbadense TaxID=3634 RepID=A0A2P5X3C1_GOSBA|nr:hypothetical protein GOBAR_AA22870 [Gossypium barbadense]